MLQSYYYMNQLIWMHYQADFGVRSYKFGSRETVHCIKSMLRIKWVAMSKWFWCDEIYTKLQHKYMQKGNILIS